MWNTKLVRFLILLEKVAVLRVMAQHLPQVYSEWTQNWGGKNEAACHLVDPFRECGLRVQQPEPGNPQLGDLAGSSRQSAPREMCCSCCCPKTEGDPEITAEPRTASLAGPAPIDGWERDITFPVWSGRILNADFSVPGFLPSGPNVDIMNQTLACISVTSRLALIRTFSFTGGNAGLLSYTRCQARRDGTHCSD